jgi:hypothetical protein
MYIVRYEVLLAVKKKNVDDDDDDDGDGDDLGSA